MTDYWGGGGYFSALRGQGQGTIEIFMDALDLPWHVLVLPCTLRLEIPVNERTEARAGGVAMAIRTILSFETDFLLNLCDMCYFLPSLLLNLRTIRSFESAVLVSLCGMCCFLPSHAISDPYEPATKHFHQDRLTLF